MRLRANLVIGGLLLGAVALTAAIAAVWTPQNPLRINTRQRLKPPSPEHWLGTDEFGRDVVPRLMAGAETSLTVALFTVACALVVGVARSGTRRATRSGGTSCRTPSRR